MQFTSPYAIFIGAVIACTSLASTPSEAAAPLHSAAATEGEVGRALAEQLSRQLESKTGMKATGVSPSPVSGLYEVTVGTSIFYMDKSGKWLFDGQMVDLDTKTSVTAQKKQALERAILPQLDWRTLNMEDAIKTVRGKSIQGRVLVTFEDPNCGYCKRLHAELDKVPNLTVYTFPISILGPDSQVKNEALWCAKDRAAAWADVMAGKAITPQAKCDLGALARNGELSRKLVVNGTPTIFLSDGSRIPGFVDAATLEQRMVGARNASAKPL